MFLQKMSSITRSVEDENPGGDAHVSYQTPLRETITGIYLILVFDM